MHAYIHTYLHTYIPTYIHTYIFMIWYDMIYGYVDLTYVLFLFWMHIQVPTSNDSVYPGPPAPAEASCAFSESTAPPGSFLGVLLVSPSGFSPVQTKKPQVATVPTSRTSHARHPQWFAVKRKQQWHKAPTDEPRNSAGRHRCDLLKSCVGMEKIKGSNSGECPSDVNLYSTMLLEKILRFF